MTVPCMKVAPLCIPQHDDRRFIVTVYDTSGALEDVSGANEITLHISRTVQTAALITKTLTGGGVVLAGTPSQFYFDISSTESGSTLARGANYYQIQIVNSAGEKQTVLSGQLTVIDTAIGD